MYGNTGFHHPKTKKEIEAHMRLEARSHANTCDELANALRVVGGSKEIAHALEQAAKFIRHFEGGKK